MWMTPTYQRWIEPCSIKNWRLPVLPEHTLRCSPALNPWKRFSPLPGHAESRNCSSDTVASQDSGHNSEATRWINSSRTLAASTFTFFLASNEPAARQTENLHGL